MKQTRKKNREGVRSWMIRGRKRERKGRNKKKKEGEEREVEGIKQNYYA